VALVLLKALPLPKAEASAVLLVLARATAEAGIALSTKGGKFRFLQLEPAPERREIRTAASSPTTFWQVGGQAGVPEAVRGVGSRAVKPAARGSMIDGRKLRDIGPIDWMPRSLLPPGAPVPPTNFIWFSALPEPVPS